MQLDNVLYILWIISAIASLIFIVLVVITLSITFLTCLWVSICAMWVFGILSVIIC